MKPDLSYALDLTVADERRMAAILVELAVIEPGENWQEETYQPRLNEPPIPGWEVSAERRNWCALVISTAIMRASSTNALVALFGT